MFQHLPHLNFLIGEGPKSSYISVLDNIGDGFKLVSLEYHQSVAELHPDLVLKFVYLKDMEDLDLFNISGLYGGK